MTRININHFLDLCNTLAENAGDYDFLPQAAEMLQQSELRKNKCWYNLPWNWTSAGDPPRVNARRHTPRNRAPFFFQALRRGLPTDDEIRKSIRQLECSTLWFLWKNENGENVLFEGNQKGTARYAKRTEVILRSTVQALAEAERETVALTLTYSPNEQGQNRAAAWLNYSENINNAIDYFRKHCGALYCWVKESTKAGYPHAHCVLSFPKGTIRGYEKMGKRCEIRYGDFYQEIKKRVPAKIFHLEKVTGKNLKWYLCKYVSKQSTQEFLKLGHGSGTLSDAERKAALCTLATIATRSRLYGKSTNAKIIKECPELKEGTIKDLMCFSVSRDVTPVLHEYGKEDGSFLPDDVHIVLDTTNTKSERTRAARRLRRHLIELCNNSPKFCERELYGKDYERLRREMGGGVIELDKLEPEDAEKFKQKALNLGCNGCIFSHLIRLAVSGYDEMLDVFEAVDGGAVVSLFTPKIFADDLRFMFNYLRLYLWLWQMVVKWRVPFANIKGAVINLDNPAEAFTKVYQHENRTKELAAEALAKMAAQC